MPEKFFQIKLSVQPKGRGEAELVPPNVLKNLNYKFVIVKEGGEEGIIMVEEPESVLKKIEKDKDCNRLTAKKVETLQKSYPTPKIKRKYRLQSLTQEAGKEVTVNAQFEVDKNGNKIIDTIQTVRSGFYLIDVPILVQSTQL